MPVRRASGGAMEVLLVTSRETRRWVIPKGWPWPELADCDSAAEEAREEAGVLGSVETTGYGKYVYSKRHVAGTTEIAVDVFLLWVAEELDDWPERAERNRIWFSPVEAAAAVEEPQLRALLLSLMDRAGQD